jgi:hypothetical protein
MRLVVQNDIQQLTVDFDAAVVVNKSQFSKFVHEETYPGSRRSDHLRKRLLADFREDRLRFLVLAKVRQQQEQPGKTFLTRIEQLIDEHATIIPKIEKPGISRVFCCKGSLAHAVVAFFSARRHRLISEERHLD